MQKIAEVDMPRISMTAEAQLRQLEQIVMNTQTIKEHTRGMLDILSQATKFADRGFYMR
jgi:hypothetical protein